MRVIVDVVPNHSSSEHRWFQEALAAGPGSPERDRYIFREGRGAEGSEPPNNWLSMFGGPAWTRITEADGTPGPWYLHLFDATQPDFDWTNPWVADRFDEVLRFWFDRGADGFRIDVAHGLAKDAGTARRRRGPAAHRRRMGGRRPPVLVAATRFTTIWRRWRRVADEYDGDRALVAEAWVMPLSKMAKWVRPDELHQAFNFGYLMTRGTPTQLRGLIDEALAEFPSSGRALHVGAVQPRHRAPHHTACPQGAATAQHRHRPAERRRPDEEFALHRGRAATLVMLALPGSAYVYQGEELGLPEAIDIPDDARQDPTFFRTPAGVYGRDGCRVPLPWEADAPAFGFSPDRRVVAASARLVGSLCGRRSGGRRGLDARDVPHGLARSPRQFFGRQAPVVGRAPTPRCSTSPWPTCASSPTCPMSRFRCRRRGMLLASGPVDGAIAPRHHGVAALRSRTSGATRGAPSGWSP